MQETYVRKRMRPQKDTFLFHLLNFHSCCFRTRLPTTTFIVVRPFFKACKITKSISETIVLVYRFCSYRDCALVSKQ